MKKTEQNTRSSLLVATERRRSDARVSVMSIKLYALNFDMCVSFMTDSFSAQHTHTRTLVKNVTSHFFTHSLTHSVSFSALHSITVEKVYDSI